MKVLCPKCSAHYEVEEAGQYCCAQCQEVFTVGVTAVSAGNPPENTKAPRKNLQNGTETAPAPAPAPAPFISCPYCMASISSAARKCSHCGEWLHGKPVEKKNETIYLLLSFFFGHLGVAEFYIGRNGHGLLLLFITLTGCCIAAFNILGTAIIGGVWLVQFILAVSFGIPKPEEEIPEAEKNDKPTTTSNVLDWIMWIILALIFLGIAGFLLFMMYKEGKIF